MKQLQKKGEEEAQKKADEYEMEKTPFDILAGDSQLRQWLESGKAPGELWPLWEEAHRAFATVFESVSHYPEHVA